jgi:hypothetical protein
MKHELIEFVRSESGQPIGVVVACSRENNDVGIGWSLCNVKLDKFDKEKALKIARGRANKIRYTRKNLPVPVRSTYKKMADRSFKYFKECKNFWFENFWWFEATKA